MRRASKRVTEQHRARLLDEENNVLRAKVKDLTAERDLWKERAEFALKKMGERLGKGVEQFIASRQMHHKTLDELKDAKDRLKHIWTWNTDMCDEEIRQVCDLRNKKWRDLV